VLIRNAEAKFFRHEFPEYLIVRETLTHFTARSRDGDYF
jgi:hypothetical protein